MIISKPADCQLTFEDINDNYKIKDYHNIAITYCSLPYENYKDFELNDKIDSGAIVLEPLAFVDIGNDLEIFKSWLDFLNEQNHAALIYVSAHSLYNKQPIFFDEKKYALCFEGYEDEKTEDILDKFEELAKVIDNPTSKFAEYILDESADWKDTMAILDNRADIYHINTHYRYLDNGITYCIYGQPQKLASLPNIYCH